MNMSMFDNDDEDVKHSRKEAETLTFPIFGAVGEFREKWAEVRREIIGRSARAQKSIQWFAQIEDLAHFTYEDLGHSGIIFEQYDFVVGNAAMRSVRGQLLRKIRREVDWK